MKLIKFLIIIIFISLIGCNKGDNVSIEQMKNLINHNLKPGDTKELIEKFLDTQGWKYKYDEYQNRYQAINPNFKVTRVFFFLYKRGHQIYLYLNEDKTFKNAVVEYVYSGL